MVQERDNVLLDDVGTLLAFTALSVFLDDVVDLLQSLDDDYAVATVSVLSRFDEPGVSTFGFESVLDLVVGACFLASLLLFDFFIPFVVLFKEFFELLIIFFFNMESHGNVEEWVLIFAFVKGFQVHKQCLFIRKIPVVTEFVVCHNAVGLVFENADLVAAQFGVNMAVLL